MQYSAIVIEDDIIQNLELCEALAVAGFDCRSAQDGWEAVRELAIQPADIAIVDMLMPRMDGAETIIAIRSRWPNTRIIAISGGSDRLPSELMLRAGTGLGANLAVEKPFNSEQLASAALDLLRPPRLRLVA